MEIGNARGVRSRAEESRQELRYTTENRDDRAHQSLPGADQSRGDRCVRGGVPGRGAGGCGGSAAQHRRHHGRRPRLRRHQPLRRVDRHAAARPDGGGRHAVPRLPLERQRVQPHPGRPDDRPLPAAGGHSRGAVRQSRPPVARRRHRGGGAYPGRGPAGAGLRHRRLRQVASRLPGPVQPGAARVRRVPRLRQRQHRLPLSRRHDGAGRLVARRRAERRGGLRHPPRRRARAALHRAEPRPAVLSVPAAPRPALPVPGAGRPRRPHRGRRVRPAGLGGRPPPRLPRYGAGDGRGHRRGPRRDRGARHRRPDPGVVLLGQRRRPVGLERPAARSEGHRLGGRAPRAVHRGVAGPHPCRDRDGPARLDPRRHADAAGAGGPRRGAVGGEPRGDGPACLRRDRPVAGPPPAGEPAPATALLGRRRHLLERRRGARRPVEARHRPLRRGAGTAAAVQSRRRRGGAE